jgi:vanillate monooxygenase ferredoxin subunit
MPHGDKFMANETLVVQVAAKRKLTDEICLIELRKPDGGQLPAFEAGAHIDVHLPGGTIRQYSLCSPPERNDYYEIAVLRDPASRGGSIAVHDGVHAGGTITISQPRNLFALCADASHHMLLAGGIGITPLMAMAWTLLSRDAKFEMHYFTRSAPKTAFREVTHAPPLSGFVRHWYDDDASSNKPSVDDLISRAPAGTHVYVCGPEGFINYVLGACERQHMPQDRVHFERFSAAPVVVHGASEFTVVVASSGQRVKVSAEETVVEALSRAGVSIPVSCEQGICGTCVTRVRSGTPDHRDLYLTDEEHAAGDCFTPCCSRSLTPELELDL